MDPYFWKTLVLNVALSKHIRETVVKMWNVMLELNQITVLMTISTCIYLMRIMMTTKRKGKKERHGLGKKERHGFTLYI